MKTRWKWNLSTVLGCLRLEKGDQLLGLATASILYYQHFATVEELMEARRWAHDVIYGEQPCPR